MGRLEAIEKRLADVVARHPIVDVKTTPTGAVFAEGPAAVLAIFAPSDLAWAVARIERLETALKAAKLYFNDSCLDGRWVVDGSDTQEHNAAIDTALVEDP